jgi:hypothetical protein
MGKQGISALAYTDASVAAAGGAALAAAATKIALWNATAHARTKKLSGHTAPVSVLEVCSRLLLRPPAVPNLRAPSSRPAARTC